MYKEKEIWEGFLRKFEIAIKSHLSAHNKFQKILIRHSKKGDKVLEIGCGPAIDSTFLVLKGRKVYALDKSKYALKVAKEVSKHFGAKISIIKGDAKKLPFKNNTFDLVFSSAVLHYFKKGLEIEKVLEEQKRVLKNNGKIIFDVPNLYSLHTIYKRVLMLLGKWPWGWETQYSINELRKLMEKNGFKVIETYSWGLDRISNILFNFVNTKPGRKLPLFIRKIYVFLFNGPKYFIKKYFPLNVGIVAKKLE